jgi:hypothetical protein
MKVSGDEVTHIHHRYCGTTIYFKFINCYYLYIMNKIEKSTALPHPSFVTRKNVNCQGNI